MKLPNLRMRSFLSSAIDFLYPPCCVSCSGIVDQSADVLCLECAGALPLISAPYCPRCGAPDIENSHLCTLVNPGRNFHLARSAAVFDEQVQKLIHRLKYQRRRHIGTYFGEKLGKMIEKDEQVAHISWLVPVPLHRTRLRERGYNQSDFVTQGISTITKLPIQTGILERTRNTRSQTKLSQDERAVNMRDVFRVTDRAAVKNQRIGLVDDVMTTGSTFDSCAGALLEAGAEKVFALAIARA